MRIIAQKSNNQNTYNFFSSGLSNSYIDGISFNITYTKDNKVVIFNTPSLEPAITNTINTSTLGELQGYEISQLEEELKNLEHVSNKKDIYILLSLPNYGVLTDTNIEMVTMNMNSYVDEVKKIVDSYPNLTINLHSYNRNLVTIMKQRITNHPIGFAITGLDPTFIDVDYYVIAANVFKDSIIDTLLKRKKEVIIYVLTSYYMSYLYEHYLGEKSTPELQQSLQKISFMTDYPLIINKLFST